MGSVDLEDDQRAVAPGRSSAWQAECAR